MSVVTRWTSVFSHCSWVNFCLITIRWSHSKSPCPECLYWFLFGFVTESSASFPLCLVLLPPHPLQPLSLVKGPSTVLMMVRRTDFGLFFTWLLLLPWHANQDVRQDGFGDSRDPFSGRWRWYWLRHNVSFSSSNYLFCYFLRMSTEVKIKHRDHWARRNAFLENFIVHCALV